MYSKLHFNSPSPTSRLAMEIIAVDHKAVRMALKWATWQRPHHASIIVRGGRGSPMDPRHGDNHPGQIRHTKEGLHAIQAMVER